MVDITTAETPAEFIEAVRSTFRAYVPESDAWAQPNFFSVNATVIGGLVWTAWNEARNGIDMRLNPQTAQGEYLDLIAAFPPLNLTRYGPTQANGFVAVNFPALASVPAGYQFEAADGTIYTATATTALTAGVGTIPVVSTATGSVVNALNNQPLIAAGGQAVSLGIYGGRDTESDDAFRARLFSAQSRPAFFGSACSYEREMLAIPGVTRAWAYSDGLVSKIAFLMEDTYPCGNPTQADIDVVEAHFADERLTNLYSCLTFEGAQTLKINPVIEWTNCPTDLCEIQTAMNEWLRENYGLGDGVKTADIDCWLKQTFPDLGPSIACCVDYPPVACAVYNCAELIGG